MRRNRPDRGPARRRAALGGLALLVLTGCATPDPAKQPPTPGPVQATVATASAPVATTRPTATPGPVESSRRASTGVTTDPGTRYLSLGSVGALTVETPIPPPPAWEETPAAE